MAAPAVGGRACAVGRGTAGSWRGGEAGAGRVSEFLWEEAGPGQRVPPQPALPQHRPELELGVAGAVLRREGGPSLPAASARRPPVPSRLELGVPQGRGIVTRPGPFLGRPEALLLRAATVVLSHRHFRIPHRRRGGLAGAAAQGGGWAGRAQAVWGSAGRPRCGQPRRGGWGSLQNAQPFWAAGEETPVLGSSPEHTGRVEAVRSGACLAFNSRSPFLWSRLCFCQTVRFGFQS